MKKIISFVLLLALTFQCLGCLGVLAWFGVQQEYIAAELCENRTLPGKRCGGQCVLTKTLKALEDGKQQDQESQQHAAKQEYIAFIVPEFESLSFMIPSMCRPQATWGKLYQFTPCDENFHPPRV